MGYAVTYVGARREACHADARGVVFAGGAIGTNELLRACKDSGALPRISDRLGRLFRTNSEALMAVTAGRPAASTTAAADDHRRDLPRRGDEVQTVTAGPGRRPVSLSCSRR